MSDERTVIMTAEQYAEVERCIEERMRMNKNDRAATLMNLALAYKFARPIEPAPPSNVVEFHGYSRKVGA